MKKIELSKIYDPKAVEDRIYQFWLKNNDFAPKIQADKKPFVMVIPPPNITGSLHMGHALNITVQDILVRYNRQKGVPTLWVPGTDHGGIATQNVVEKELAKEGKTRFDLGQEKFVEKTWEWQKKYGHIITDQIKKLGASCDWSRERFTMDADYSKAVNAAFEHYYKKGWIYQSQRVINWCPRCQTSLSDIEIEYKEQKTKLYYFKYDKNFPILIATTRPETKLGDTAVAVNPKDKKYKEFIGKTFDVNFCGQKRKIQIIADSNIDQKYGCGAVGVTPAHSLVDAEMARKNSLPSITVIDQNGKMTSQAGKDFEGLKVKEAREKILEYLRDNNLLEKKEGFDHNLSVCYRCGREIEPQPSLQWFLKMSELAKPAIEAVESGKIKFEPDRWKKVYLDWMKNLQDWCISRQIWWGHRLPVYIKQEEIQNPKLQIPNKSQIQNSKNQNNSNDLDIRNSDLEIYVGNTPPKNYKQVTDVLDTWFSSALWPFAVFLKKNGSNLKRKTKNEKVNKITGIFGEDFDANDLDYFYPTTVLSTARDILYLWVARMIFSGIEFTGQIPFEKVYIHPTILTKEGKRMSKSLGTGVDPLDLIEKYGADAVRFGLTYINTGIQDIRFSEDAIITGQKFANKIWNASRFALTQNADKKPASLSLQRGEQLTINEKQDAITKEDSIILEKLGKIIKSTDKNIENFHFGKMAHEIYDFFWHDFCDLYLEQSKAQLQDEKIKENTQKILTYVLQKSLDLLHPIMPFITQEITNKINNFQFPNFH